MTKNAAQTLPSAGRIKRGRGVLSALRAGWIDLLFPPRCAGCRGWGHLFCPRCAQAVQPMPAQICLTCGRPHGDLLIPGPVRQCESCREVADWPFVFVRAATLFGEPVRSGIHGLKYEGRAELAVALARYLVAVYRQEPWSGTATGDAAGDAAGEQIDGCLAVPLHPSRLAGRGYNQSALLGAHFAQAVGLPFWPDWVSRDRATQSQARLSAQERQQNVRGAFRADPQIEGKRLLLIDDVMTTGATLVACAQALRKAGAAEIYGLVLATPPK